jgi:deazaflavin-dependent oxidoreductase (nitroreductase family)
MMSDDKVTITEAESSRLDFIGEHLNSYLSSGGAEGHIVDFTAIGGLPFTTTLLLETFGRKSGERRVNPLIYGTHGGKVIVVASKGGADVHPAWYFNLQATRDVVVQIGTQAFRATWHEAQGSERNLLWDFMAGNYPPYLEYEAATGREIPVIVFDMGDPVAPLKP